MGETSEQIFQAVDILIKDRLKSIKFNRTITGIIVQNNNADYGEYRVKAIDKNSNMGGSFLAYSNQKDFQIDEQVLVAIPNDDYDYEKIILGRVIKSDSDHYISYVDPFNSIVDITGNLAHDGDIFLYANGKTKSTRVCQYQNFDNPITGYTRLGIRADFSAWLTSLGVIPNENTPYESFGLELTCYVMQSTTTLADLTPTNYGTVSFQLDSHNDFYGNIYGFESYYSQAVVFDISSLKDMKIVAFELNFYQNQEFKTRKGEYAESPDFDLADLNAKLSAGTVHNLAEYYAQQTDNYENLAFAPNLYMKNPWVCFGYGIEEFSKDDVVLYSYSSLTYDRTKTDNENKKAVYMRWIHVDSDTGKKFSVSTTWLNEHKLEAYEINWYQYKLGAPSPNDHGYAGPNWVLKTTYRTNDASTFPTTDSFKKIFFYDFIPDVTKETEQIKCAIFQNGTFLADCDPIVFRNEKEVINTLQTDLDSALSIVCGYPVENANDPDKNFFLDTHQGSFFIYKKGNELVDESKAQEMFSLSPSFDSMQASGELTNDLVLLRNATALVWSFPASNSMLRPVLGTDEFITNQMIRSGTTLSDTLQQYFANAYARKLIKYDSSKRVYVIYNERLDTIEFLHLGMEDNPNTLNADETGALNVSTDGDIGSVIQHYYIERNYAPQRVNNTVELEILKDRIRYRTSRTFYFGQSGSSGSPYTIVLDFKNNVNVLTVQNTVNATVYTGTDNYYALMPSVRLVDTNGKDVIDFSVSQPDINVEFDWLYSQVAGQIRQVQEYETKDLYYPVKFTNGRHFLTPENDPNTTAEYYITEGVPSASNTYYYFVAPDGVQQTKGRFEQETLEQVNSTLNSRFHYRKLNANQKKYKIVYEEINIDNENDYNIKTQNGKYFVLINGYYILDPYPEYNEVQHYYAAKLSEACIDQYSVLTASNRGPNNEALPKNQTFININSQWQSLTGNALSTSAIMNSISVLRITITGFGDYPLVKYFPIAIRRAATTLVINEQDYSAVAWYQSINGATEIQYHSTGEVPSYYQKSYEIRIVNKENGELITTDTIISNNSTILSGIWNLFIPDYNELSAIYVPELQNGILKPLPIYIPEAPHFGVQYSVGGLVCWTQPILVYQDNYPSSTINAWNGKDIVINDEQGEIVASAIAAGKKDRENKFSGVMLGDWSRSDTASSIANQTGIYGFSKGEMSFAFKEDGTAFIGKDGSGRIYLAGDKAQIYSSKWIVSRSGLFFDLDKGDIELAYKTTYTRKIFNNLSDYQTFLRTKDPSIALYLYEDYHPITTSSQYNTIKRNSVVYYPSFFSLQPLDLLLNGQSDLKARKYIYYTKEDEINTDVVDTSTEYSMDQEGLYNIYTSSIVINNTGITFNEINITYVAEQTFITPHGETEPIEVWVKRKKTSTISNRYVLIPEGTDFTTLTKVIQVEEPDGQGGVHTVDKTVQKDIYRAIQYLPVPSFTRDSADEYGLYNDFSTYQEGYYYYIPSVLDDKYTEKVWSSTSNASNHYPNDQFDPEGAYYTRPRESATVQQRYASLNANEVTYPFAIGKNANPAGRGFRVNWDGDVFISNGDFTGIIKATGGSISGDLEVYGTLHGGEFIGGRMYTNYLEADDGLIGGWTINSTYLQSADGITTLYCNSNNSPESVNIVTDTIKINGVGKNNANISAVFGVVNGVENGVTYKMGMRSDNTGLIFYGADHSALRSKQSVFIDSSYSTNGTFAGSVQVRQSGVIYLLTTTAGGKIVIAKDDSGGKAPAFEVYADKVKFTATASNQEGIYARFA